MKTAFQQRKEHIPRSWEEGVWYILEAAMCTKKKKAAPEEANVECPVQSMRNFSFRGY